MIDQINESFMKGVADMAEKVIKEKDDRITTLENTLRQARDALEEARNTDDSLAKWDRHHNALAAIDAVLSGAPPSEITDERILELWKNMDVPAEWETLLVNFARAVLKEGK